MADQTRSDVALLYRRAGFGLRGRELDAVAAGGYGAAVDQLIAGLSAADAAGDAVTPPTFAPYQPKFRPPHAELTALQTWWMGRMAATSTPLREKLTLLWHGHFATAVSKVRDPKLMYLQNQVFRTAGAGHFGDLVKAVAKGGAMMIWLDTASDKASHPNENFARELMELFTLGIGNYTQDDVVAAARGFTGWAYDRHTDEWRQVARTHDGGAKTFLGATADFDGDAIIDRIVAQPTSARFVTAKLWSHLAYPVAPTDPVVHDLAPAFGRDLDLTGLLRAIFGHPAFLSDPSRTGLVKQPIEYLVGAARALGVAPTGLPAAARALAQVPFDPPSVGGWGQNGYWLDTATALARLGAAERLVRTADLSAIEAAAPSARADAAADLLGLDGWGSTTAAALSHTVGNPRLLTAMAVASPEYVEA